MEAQRCPLLEPVMVQGVQKARAPSIFKKAGSGSSQIWASVSSFETDFLPGLKRQLTRGVIWTWTPWPQPQSHAASMRTPLSGSGRQRGSVLSGQEACSLQSCSSVQSWEAGLRDKGVLGHSLLCKQSPHRLESRGLVATWLQPGVFNLTIFQKNPPVAVWEGVLLAGSR